MRIRTNTSRKWGMATWCVQPQGAQRHGASSREGHSDMVHVVMKAQQEEMTMGMTPTAPIQRIEEEEDHLATPMEGPREQ